MIKGKWVAVLLMGCLGCADGETFSEQEPGDGQVTPPVAEQDPLNGIAPIAASKVMPSGNVVTIYDFQGGALVTETGEAYNGPSFTPVRGEVRSLAKLWAAIAPNEPIPIALSDLQRRIDAASENQTPPPKEVTEGVAEARAKQKLPMPPLTKPLSPQGCNNGCCDYDWMYNSFWMCNEDYDVDWMNFNGQYGSKNVNDAWIYDMFVCSAAGTTRYEFSLGDAASALVDIRQRHYYLDWWIAPTSWSPFGGCCVDEDLWAFVNEPFEPHLHTWCGGVERD
jgi:hypothetical protein